jgi:hypothetical protein
MTLHEAMMKVLGPSGAMTSREIADAIAMRGLYTRKDGKFASASQVSARANKNPEIFERIGDAIKKRR